MKKTLGATFNPKTNSVDFRLYSKEADEVTLEIFEHAYDNEALASFTLDCNSDGIWETSIKKYALFNLKKPFYYDYRINGKSKFFNPEHLAYDPYSKSLAYNNKIENYEIKSVFFEYTPIQIQKTSNRLFTNEIIAEVHLKDLTYNLEVKTPSTYKAAGEFAKALKKMNVSMIEFLPLNDFDNNGNYWGYMPLGYFALQKEYSSATTPQGVIEEFQEMINEFHKQDIKVCMDVVYNHSADNASFKLIDAKSYYKINPDGYFMNNSGCGNDLKIANNAFSNLVADSISYFANLGVDAFRFDLGLSLMDTDEEYQNNYNNQTSFIAKLPQMLSERGIKVSDGTSDGIVLIAEPWTCGGENCYGLGKFPNFVYEWNDIARNIIRSSTIRPDCLEFTDYKDLIEGTKSIFKDKNRSINYIASHDGFTLLDLNTYYEDCWEICGDHFKDKERQLNSIKKQIILLLLAKGATMIQLGDLIAHTKKGNHNSYKEDNETNYLDFSNINKNKNVNNIFNFWQKMINFRLQYNPQDWKRLYYKENSEIIIDDTKANNEYFSYLGESNNLKRFFVASNNSMKDITIKLPAPRMNKDWKIYLRSSEGKEKFILKPYEIVLYIEENV